MEKNAGVYRYFMYHTKLQSVTFNCNHNQFLATPQQVTTMGLLINVVLGNFET